MSINLKSKQQHHTYTNEVKTKIKSDFLDLVKTKCLPPLCDYSKKYSKNELEDIFIQESKYKEYKRYDFALNKFFVSEHGQVVKMKPLTLERFVDKRYHKTLFKIQQLQEKNKEMEGVFITLTLPSEYHNKNSSSKKSKYNLKGFKEGYDNFKDTFTIIKKKISKRFGKSFDYVNMLEPHKDYTPHIHRQYWVDSDKIDKFIEYVENTINNQIKNRKIGIQYDIVKVSKNDNSNISGYITKYIIKNVDKQQNNTKILRVLDGWNRLLRFRSFTTSNTPIPATSYNKLLSLIEDNIVKDSGFENLGQYVYHRVKYHSIIDNKKHKINNNPKQFDYFLQKHTTNTYNPYKNNGVGGYIVSIGFNLYNEELSKLGELWVMREQDFKEFGLDFYVIKVRSVVVNNVSYFPQTLPTTLIEEYG